MIFKKRTDFCLLAIVASVAVLMVTSQELQQNDVCVSLIYLFNQVKGGGSQL